MGYGIKRLSGLGALPTSQIQFSLQQQQTSQAKAAAGQASPNVAPLSNMAKLIPMQIAAQQQAVPSSQSPAARLKFTPAQLRTMERAANLQKVEIRPDSNPPVVQRATKDDGIPPRSAIITSTPTPKPSASQFFNAQPPSLKKAMERAANVGSNDMKPNVVADTSNRTDLPPAIEETLELTETLKDATDAPSATYTMQTSGGEQYQVTTATAAPKKGFAWWVWLVGGLGLAVAAGTIYSKMRKK